MTNVENKEKYNAEEVLQQIIYLAHHEHDMAEFGINVAGVLFEHGCINEAIYEVLVGK